MQVAILTLLLYLAWAAVCSAPAFLLARFLPASHPWFRYLTTAVAFALLVTPSLGSAAITVVALPFAVYLFIAIVSLDISPVTWALQEWPVWHAAAFPVTLLVALLIFRRLRPNNSFKPTPLRGAA